MQIGENTVELSKKSQVYFGLIAGIVYALVHCLFRILSKEPINPWQIAFQLFFFSILWYFVFFRLMRNKQNDLGFEYAEDQSVSFYGAAHRVNGAKTTVGVLYATSTKLSYNTEVTTPQVAVWQVDWQEIESVEVYKMAGLFDYGILLKTKGQRPLKFAVNEPKTWVNSIQAELNLKQ